MDLSYAATLADPYCAQKKEDEIIAEQRRQAKYQKEHMYSDLHTEENMEGASNQDRDADFLDDFF